MGEGQILEFDGVGREQYDAVNARLGIDQYRGKATGRLGSSCTPAARGRRVGRL
jgi:hypothetical protein